MRVSESKLWLGKRLSNRFFHRSAGAGACVRDPDVHTHSHSRAHRSSQVHARPLAQLSSHRTAWHFHPDCRSRPDPKAYGHRIQTHSPGSTPHAPLLFGFLPSAVTPTSPRPHTWHGPTLPGTKVTPRPHRPDRPSSLTRVLLVAGVNRRDGFGRQCSKHRVRFLEQRHPPLEALTSVHHRASGPDLPRPASRQEFSAPLVRGSRRRLTPFLVFSPFFFCFSSSSFSFSLLFSCSFFCSPGLAPPVPSSPVTDTGRCFGEDRGG